MQNIRNRACGIYIDNNTILLIQHKLWTSKNIFWSPPGGRVNLNESLPNALVREFFEETGLQVIVKKFLFVNEVISPHTHSLEYFFEVEKIGGNLLKGIDPELETHNQIIENVKFLSIDEIKALPKNEVHNLFWGIDSLQEIYAMHGFYQWQP
jgi:8-oxo-dGTP diphosphatase